MNRTTLNKATSADATPTPGYLFDEIAKVTHDPIGNERLVEYLLRRIESPSPDVKAKVLNIIKQVCRKGNPAFRKALQRDGATAIKSLLKFHCAPDPLRGDEPSRRVRENAQEACNAVFDASKDERNLANPSISSRIQGFGGEQPAPQQQQYAAPAYQSQQAPTSRYQGIGNPAFALPTASTAAAQDGGMLGRITSVVKERFDRTVAAAQQGGNQPPPLPTFASSPQQGRGDYSFASNRMQQFQQQMYDPQESRRNNTTTSSSTATKTAVEGYELQLVDELTNSIGIKAVPPKDKLEVFCLACKSTQVDCQSIVHRLNERLLEGEEKVQRKTLAVVERMLQDPELLEKFGDWFDAEIEPMEALFRSSSSLVRAQVAKVWKLLYEEEEEEQVAAQPPQQASLFEFTPAAAPHQQDVVDMFQNLQVKSATAAPARVVPLSSGFGFIAPAPHKPVNLLDSDDFFSMTTPTIATSAPTQQQQQPMSFISVQTSYAPPPPSQQQQQQAKKPADSFGFVQEALAAKRNF